MKKHFLLALIAPALFLASCKKQYACQCASTFSKTGYSSYVVSSVENIDEKTTKKTAQQICVQTEKQLEQNNQDYIAGGPSESVTVSCALK